MRIHVGTSGYNYPEWRGSFYPEKYSAKRMFAFYSERFHAVEINYTFYRVPVPKTTEAWRAQAPPAFSYTLKAPRRITHDKRLADCTDVLTVFCDSARLLGPHLGPLLFQLAPSFRCDLPRLRAFLGQLPGDLRTAFEFRHPSWLNEEVYAALREHNAALCIADFGDKTTPLVATARHGYFRLRDEGYVTEDFSRWADAVAAQATVWDDAFVFFKHEDEGKGPAFAAAFIEELQKRQLTVA
ncbi:MAG: DUF72 domain-containing protein [Vicinamibacterales bacterium]